MAEHPETETPQPSSPLLFVPNQGQFDPAVRFQLRGAGGTWWFTDDAIWLTVIRGSPSPRPTVLAPGLGEVAAPQPRTGVNLRLMFPGMNPDTRMVGADPQSAKMNYFLGNDAAKWRSEVPTFGAVRWEGVYPGISVVFGGSPLAGAGLGLTIEAGRGADLSALRLRVEGADGVRVDAGERLVADTAIGAIALPPMFDGEGAQFGPAVTGDTATFGPSPFFQRGEELGVRATPADDPSELIFSTYLGGSGVFIDGYGELVSEITVDDAGITHVSGSTPSSNFPTTPGAFDPTFNGGYFPVDAFISKLDAEGSSLVYSTFLGGSMQVPGGNDYAYDMYLAADGSIYIAGYTRSSDFPLTAGAYDTTCNGGFYNVCDDAYLAHLSSEGDALIFSTLLGGDGADAAVQIAIGEDGSVYSAGSSGSTNFPTTLGAFDTTFNGGCYWGDSFVTKLNATGSALVYSTYLGGSLGCDSVSNLVLNADGIAYIVGYTDSGDFPTAVGSYDTSYNGGGDAYVTKLNSDGSSLLYSAFLGDSELDYAHAAVLGVDGSITLVGSTMSSGFPAIAGGYDTTYNGNGDSFVSQINAAGSALVYSTFLGGNDSDTAHDIVSGADGSVVLSGTTDSADFPTVAGAFDTTHNGCGDAYIVKLDSSVGSLLYGTFLGGTDDECSISRCYIVLTGDYTAYTAGDTVSDNFPTTPGAFDTTYNGGLTDLFISKLNLDPDLPTMHVASIDPAYRPSGDRYRVGTSVTIQDMAGATVPQARVILKVTFPDGDYVAYDLDTNQRGKATVSFITAETGTYIFKAIDVRKEGLVYDPAQNVETRDYITVP